MADKPEDRKQQATSILQTEPLVFEPEEVQITQNEGGCPFGGGEAGALERLIGQLGCREKRREALEGLYQSLYREVFACALALCGKAQMAEDARNETFVRLVQSAGSYRPQGKPKAYVLAITRNVVREMTRHARRECATQELPEIPCPAAEAENGITLKALIALLPDREREVVILHDCLDWTLEQVASFLHLPLGTVKARHAKAIHRLRAAAADAA